MRHGSQGRRSRNRGHNNNQGGRNRSGAYNRNQIFDSNGPDVRIRGTAHQVCEKYLALAKDAQAVGDTIQAENYLQHAEHYQRIINSWNEEFRDNNRTSGEREENKSTVYEDDLSLPDSILGDEVKVESKKVQQEQVAQEEGVLEAV